MRLLEMNIMKLFLLAKETDNCEAQAAHEVLKKVLNKWRKYQ